MARGARVHHVSSASGPTPRTSRRPGTYVAPTWTACPYDRKNERRVRLGHGGGVRFRNGQGFAGKQRFINPQIPAPKKPKIGRHRRTFFQKQDIARYQFPAFHLVTHAFAPHDHAWRDHAAQGLRAGFRLPLLSRPDKGIDLEHDEDEDGVRSFLNNKRDCRRDQQQKNKRAFELTEVDGERRNPLGFRQHVFAKALPACGDRQFAEAFPLRLQLGERRLDTDGMPRTVNVRLEGEPQPSCDLLIYVGLPRPGFWCLPLFDGSGPFRLFMAF